MLKLMIDGEFIAVAVAKFPAGEMHVRIHDEGYRVINNIEIVLNYRSNDDLVALALLKDAVERKYEFNRISLAIPYFPYARQDRVCNDGESLSVKVIANFINGLDFDEVYVYDPHSDVVGAVVNKIRIFEMTHLVHLLLTKTFSPEKVILVAPDAGATKKVQKVAQQYGYEYVTASKVRDTKTGKLSNTVVYSEHVGDKDFLILDDICEGGRTFNLLAPKLQELTFGKVYLYVTHGIFSKGYDELAKNFEKVYTANLMGKENPLVETITL